MSMDSKKELEEGKVRLELLDAFLRTAESIPDDLWWSICDAIGYDAATPVSWACGRLKVLYLRTENDESISVPAANVILCKDTFKTFILEYFSPFIYECILKH
jgi:hypothetical protein